MRHALLAAAAAALMLASPALARAPNGSGGSGLDREIWSTITAAQASQLIAARGGTVTETLTGEEGGWSVNFTFSNGLNAYAEGLDCEGEGPTAVCSDLEIGAVFTADDPAHASRLEDELSFMWLADFAEPDNADYQVWRRDCLHAGMTRGQVAMLFQIAEETILAVSYAIWPEETAPRNTPVET